MSMLSVEEAFVAYPHVVETSVVTRSESQTEHSKRAFVVLDEGSDSTVRSFYEWCQRDLQDILEGVEVHVLSSVAKGTVARRQLVAVFDSHEAWIATNENVVSAKQHTEPWVNLSLATKE